MMDAAEIIRILDLAPHPEGGWYRELHRSALKVTTPHASRCALTSIYYLLEAHECSRWHTVDADEVWHFYAGAPLELFAYEPAARRYVGRVLAPPSAPTPSGAHTPSSAVSAPSARSEPVAVIPAGTWQAARSLGAYSLVGCTVGPGFEFADFRFVSDLADHPDHFTGALAPLRALL